MANWFSGSGLAKLLFGILQKPEFQEAAIETAVGIGRKILENISNPAVLKKIGDNLVENPHVVVGAMVKGTEAEELVDDSIVKEAEVELAKPGH